MSKFLKWALALNFTVAFSISGCGYVDPSSNAGTQAQLRTQRQGPKDGCLFNTRGALSEAYPCAPLSIMASSSATANVATIIFSPVPAKATVQGMVQLSALELTEGKYSLKDFKNAS